MLQTLIFIVLGGLFVFWAVLLVRYQERFYRSWKSLDKRVTEILWRTRKSEPGELHRLSVSLQEMAQASLSDVKTVATSLHSELEKVTSQIRASSVKMKRHGFRGVDQSDEIVFALERICKKLGTLERIEQNLTAHLGDVEEPEESEEQPPETPPRDTVNIPDVL